MGGSFPALADQVKVLALGDEVAELFFHVIFFGYPGTPFPPVQEIHGRSFLRPDVSGWWWKIIP